MRLSIAGLFAAVLASGALATGAALACNVGDIACNNGYQYVCRCWTATGCDYQYEGVCHHDDGAAGRSPLAGYPLFGRYAYLTRAAFVRSPAQ